MKYSENVLGVMRIRGGGDSGEEEESTWLQEFRAELRVTRRGPVPSAGDAPNAAETAAAQRSRMNTDDALRAFQSGEIERMADYPLDATDEEKHDADVSNVIVVNNYHLKIVVGNLREDVTAAAAATPAPALTRTQQLIAKDKEDFQRRLAEHEDQLEQNAIGLEEVRQQQAVLTQTVADQGERLSTVEERLDRADAERSPPRRNPPRGKKGKGGKKQK